MVRSNYCIWSVPVNYPKFFRSQFSCRTVLDKSFMPVLQLCLTFNISEIENAFSSWSIRKLKRNSVKEFHVSILDPKTKLGGLNDDEHSNSKPEFYFPCYGNYYRSYSNSRNPPHYIRSWEDTLKRTSHSFIISFKAFELHIRARAPQDVDVPWRLDEGSLVHGKRRLLVPSGFLGPLNSEQSIFADFDVS